MEQAVGQPAPLYHHVYHASLQTAPQSWPLLLSPLCREGTEYLESPSNFPEPFLCIFLLGASLFPNLSCKWAEKQVYSSAALIIAEIVFTTTLPRATHISSPPKNQVESSDPFWPIDSETWDLDVPSRQRQLGVDALPLSTLLPRSDDPRLCVPDRPMEEDFFASIRCLMSKKWICGLISPLTFQELTSFGNSNNIVIYYY